MNREDLKEARILIVDDEEANVLLLEGLLKKAAFHQFTSTRDGREAVACFTTFKPDLILLDLLMQPLDGFQVMEHLRPLIPEDGYLPILVLTADMSPGTRQRALSSGAKDFLTKPLDVTETLLRIRNLLEARFLHLQLTAQNIRLEERVKMRTAELLNVNGELAAEIKDHLKTAEALRASEQRFRSLVETTSDWIWEVDATGHYTYASPRIRELLGYEPDAVVGRKAFQLAEAEGAQRGTSLLKRILQARDPVGRFERTDRHKDGRSVVLETSVVPILDGNGKVAGCRGIDRDVTERKLLEAQLRQAQKMEAVGRLAGGVAHDFNNLLTVILGYTQLMLSQEETDEEAKELLRTVLTAGEKAGKLTRQLLMFSRTKPASAELLDLNELVRGLSSMLARIIGEDVRLHSRLGDQLPCVRADPGMLEQVLMNLVVNARDAMPQGGDLYLETSTAELDTSHSRKNLEASKGMFVVLLVSDTGCGIPPEIMNRIFEPFFTTKEAGKGTGLGLATVYGIVKQHSGWVEVESAVGKGTRFRVFLPGVPKSATEKAALPVEQKIKGGTETILVVEDEATLQTLARLVLEKHGYRVLTAASGKEALRIWGKHSGGIDLLLTDVVMPDNMTGRDLAEQLRREKPGISIICTSGYGRDATGMDTEFMKRARIRFLQKPYRPQVLARLIRESLDAKD
jgi:PAS domain S-box-containing protein